MVLKVPICSVSSVCGNKMLAQKLLWDVEDSSKLQYKHAGWWKRACGQPYSVRLLLLRWLDLPQSVRFQPHRSPNHSPGQGSRRQTPVLPAPPALSCPPAPRTPTCCCCWRCHSAGQVSRGWAGWVGWRWSELAGWAARWPPGPDPWPAGGCECGAGGSRARCGGWLANAAGDALSPAAWLLEAVRECTHTRTRAHKNNIHIKNNNIHTKNRKSIQWRCMHHVED